MEKINFEDGQLVNAGYVEIDGVQHEVHEAEYQGNTPLSAHTLNKMQGNIEKELNSTKTIQGESITIENACNSKAHLKVYGKTIKEGNTIRNVGDNVNLFDVENKWTKETSTVYKLDLIENENYVVKIYNPDTSKTYRIKSSEYKDSTTNWQITLNSENNYMANITNTIAQANKSKKIGLIIWNNEIGTELTYEEVKNLKIKIEKGTIATGYSKYGCGTIEFEKNNETISFPLSEGLRLHEGDYLADDGIHQKKKTVIFDGTENWMFNADNNIFGVALSSINDMAIENSFSGTAKSIIISSHFTSSIWYNLYNKLVNNAISGHNSAKAIEIRSTQFNSVESFKTYLAQQYVNGTPVTVEYELEEEKIIPYTTEQEYNKLRLMNEGQNSITTISEIKPNLECIYYYNNDLNKAYTKRFDGLEKIIEKLDENIIIPINVFKNEKISNYKSYGNSYYYKIGSKVHVHLGIKIDTKEWITLFTLPERI